jgi:hypothetical protein
MYIVMLEYECGRYFTFARDANEVSERVAEIEKNRTDNFCEHQLVSDIILDLDDCNHQWLYMGCCAFGA